MPDNPFTLHVLANLVGLLKREGGRFACHVFPRCGNVALWVAHTSGPMRPNREEAKEVAKRIWEGEKGCFKTTI